jgi:hypothetical protein
MGKRCVGTRWPVATGLHIALACLAVTLTAPACGQASETPVEREWRQHENRPHVVLPTPPVLQRIPPGPASAFRRSVQWETHVTEGDLPPRVADSQSVNGCRRLLPKRSNGTVAVAKPSKGTAAVELSLRNDRLVVEVRLPSAVAISGTIDESDPTQTTAFLKSLISPDVTSDVCADRGAARRIEKTYGIVLPAG